MFESLRNPYHHCAALNNTYSFGILISLMAFYLNR